MTDEEKAEEYAKGKAHEHYNFLFEENSGSPIDFAKLCYLDGLAEGRKESTTVSTHLTNCPTYKKLQQLEKQNKALGERVLQLQADKGKLIDENRQLKAQVEKMKCCQNCEKYVGGSCELINCKYQYVEENRDVYNEDKWELAE